ncbi:MAG: putative toxin-antitoxin system toxin component, PIN family [Deltaproteobacteria bacterium]|nr:putative toxin-antitoxin system toxin component, PIN family [Deltaproteobacteria bacterium]
MLRIVVDTNVVVSALLKSQSNPALILSLFIQGEYTVCLSKEIFAEYEEVLVRDKFKGLDEAEVKKLLTLFTRRALWVVPKVSIRDVAKEPADNAFLECALEAKADFIVTGNIHHFPVKEFHNTYIVTPSEFLNLMIQLIIK